jgi:hypothetical protein
MDKPDKIGKVRAEKRKRDKGAKVNTPTVVQATPPKTADHTPPLTTGEESAEKRKGGTPEVNTNATTPSTSTEAKKSSTSVHVMNAYQLAESDQMSPLLPPDCFEDKKKYINMVESDARSWYQCFRAMDTSRRTKRKYVYGSRHKNLYSQRCEFLKWSETGDLDIMIECADGAKTIVKLRSAKGNHAYLRSLVELDQALGSKGNARKYTGDKGEMWQLGLLNMGKGTNPTTVPTKWIGVSDKLGPLQVLARGYLLEAFPREFDAIDLMNRRNKVDACDEMGGMEGAVSTMMATMDLGNATHVDLDSSVGISTWVESLPGVAKNWHFLMPNVTRDGERALVIVLEHGTTIMWDGRLVRHNTSDSECGEGNHVYGNWFAASS